MKPLLLFLAVAAAHSEVTVSEGALSIPTYEHSTRETQPPLFANSTVTGLYPFPTFVMPFTPDSPRPRTYKAIFLENEYLRLTYLPELGGRIFSLYDKVRAREVFYRNDVIKPAHYNPRLSWPQSGIEITGPYDAHMLTLYGEPWWSNTIVRRSDGSVSLVLGETDPVYGMKVNLSATLHPGVAAMEIGVFCYNGRQGRMPQMIWISAALPGTPRTRFIYPMTRTIGHTTSEIADWPVFNGVDYSWDRNNRNMLGVFGIDIYDDFQGAYHHDLDYGVFRHADRRIVQGMKMWTFGYGANAKNLERGYTDNAGPYVEVQSGRHVWDGHYEWVAPHSVESWSEWWIPVSGIGGLTTIRRDVALNLEEKDGALRIGLSAARVIAGAKVRLTAGSRELWSGAADLAPGKPFLQSVPAAAGLSGVRVAVADAQGAQLLDYTRPGENPGRKQYTPFTKPLEKPQTPPDSMSVEQLVLAAEFKFKELNSSAAIELLNRALSKDPGYSRAHLQFGIHHFNAGRHAEAIGHLEKVIERDAYRDEAYYYLAMSQFAAGQEDRAARNLYYIWPGSAFYGAREYQLGRLALRLKRNGDAAAHFNRAIVANGHDLNARLLLSLLLREEGRREAALRQLDEIRAIDPANRPAAAERYLLTGSDADRSELVRLMGGQSREALDVSLFYTAEGRWRQAAQVLQLVEDSGREPWGASPEYYYTIAFCEARQDRAAQAAAYRRKARAAAANIDRFPFRPEAEPVFRDAIRADERDVLARFYLGCLLYHLSRPGGAIAEWRAAVEADPNHFGARRALGLALAEQGEGWQKAAVELEKAVELNPAHVRTLNDLSALYSGAGRFADQLRVLNRALERSPNDDDLAEALLGANLAEGRYEDAMKLVTTHRFAPRHRSYGLRDKYRLMRYGQGAALFFKGEYAAALREFEAALAPPVSLGADDFAGQTSPRAEYLKGRALEAMGRRDDARAAWERAAAGAAQLSGDRDSWNSENWYIVLSLDRLARKDDAAKLAVRFGNFAASQRHSRNRQRRAEAAYLLALAARRSGDSAGVRRLLDEALLAQPDFLPARLELRADSPGRL